MQMGQDNDFSNDQKKIHVNPSRLTSEANESRKYYSDIEKFIEAWQFTKDNSTGEKRLQFGLDQAILDFGRMLGSKLVINEKEFDGTEISKYLGETINADDKKKYVTDTFLKLDVKEGFRDNIIAEFTQGGQCYGATSFFALSLNQEDLFIGSDSVSRDGYEFTKINNKQVHFESNISIHTVQYPVSELSYTIKDVKKNINGDAAATQEEPKVKPILKCKTSFDFIWDEKKQKMHIKNINLELEPGQSLKKYTEKNKKKDTNNNQEENNKEGEFNEVFSSFLDFIDERLEQMQQLGYTDDMKQEEALANLLEAEIKNPCEDTYGKLDKFLAKNVRIKTSLSNLIAYTKKDSHLRKRANQIDKKVKEISPDGATNILTAPIGSTEIAAMFGDEDLVRKHCFKEENWLVLIIKTILVILSLQKEENGDLKDFFGLCSENKNYTKQLKSDVKNLKKINLKNLFGKLFITDVLATFCKDEAYALDQLLQESRLPEGASFLKSISNTSAQIAAKNNNAQYLKAVMPTFTSSESIVRQDKITAISSILELAVINESKEALQYIKELTDTNNNFKSLIKEIPENDIKKIDQIISTQSDTSGNCAKYKDLWTAIRRDLDYVQQNVDDTKKLEEITKSASKFADCLKSENTKDPGSRKRKQVALDGQDSINDLHPEPTPKKPKAETNER